MPSTQPVWEEIPADNTFQSPLPASADVCVVGAGIAGLSVAYALARAGSGDWKVLSAGISSQTG